MGIFVMLDVPRDLTSSDTCLVATFHSTNDTTGRLVA